MTLATPADLALLVPEMILVGAALLLLLAARRIRGGRVATVVTVLAAVAAGVAACRLPSGGAGAAAMTGFGGMLTVDPYSRFFEVLVAATLALTALMWARGDDPEKVPRGEVHSLLLLATSGMMLAVSALDLLTLYLALELMTLASYTLVGVRVERPAANEAAIKYFLIASFASALLLFGISLTYGVTGATRLEAVAAAFSRGDVDGPLALAALGLVVGGLAFKIAAVPFHAWAPDAYEGADPQVSAFLASGSKAVGLAALGRVGLIAFGPEGSALSLMLLALAALSMLAGSVILLSQTGMQRLLAYSSIAHVGYALLGLAAGTGAGASATMTYAFFYAFMTLGAFAVVVALGERGGRLDGFRGLAAQRPGLAALMLLFLLALVGIPPTAGFAAKFVVILSAVRAGHAALAVLAVACSVVSAFLYMRVAVLMYMREPRQPAPPPVPPALRAALAVAALVTLIGGIFPGAVAAWAVAP